MRASDTNECDQRHADIIIEALNLDKNAKGVTTPGVRNIRPDDDIELIGEDASFSEHWRRV